MQEVILLRVSHAVALGMSAKGGGHRGAARANPREKTEERLTRYRDSLGAFYTANPGAKWS